MGFFSSLFKSSSSSPKAERPKPNSKLIGEVTHFYGGISVAIVKFKEVVKVGDAVQFFGATTDFKENIKSMQYDHKDISEASKGQEVGIKVDGKVREGDEVYRA
ncbi:translation elongation factor-like protein [bacterium]|nr:MAG: translation elongation factor-like protein [bacterium]